MAVRLKRDFLEEFLKVKWEIRVLLVMFLSIFIIGTVGFMLLKGVTVQEGFVYTLETLTFSHSQDEEGITKIFQLFLLLFGVVVVWFAIENSFALMVEGQLNKYFGGKRMMDHIKRLRNHYIICGGGRVGEHVAELLKAKKQQFVLIDKHEMIADELSRKNYLVMRGDALDEDDLDYARIKYAKAVISVLPETEKNILVALTAKEMNPKITIYSRSHKPEYVKKLKKAGADYVFMPELACAEEIIGQLRIRKR